MKKTVTVLLALTLAAGCGGGTNKPDLAACEQAIRANLATAVASPSATPAGRPAACEGASEEQLTAMLGRATEDQLKGALASEPAVASPTPSFSALPTPTLPAGPDAFMAELQSNGFGGEDIHNLAFVDVGRTACKGLRDGVSFEDQVQVFTESDSAPTTQQAEAFVRSAVRNLCPKYKSMLP